MSGRQLTVAIVEQSRKFPAMSANSEELADGDGLAQDEPPDRDHDENSISGVVPSEDEE